MDQLLYIALLCPYSVTNIYLTIWYLLLSRIYEGQTFKNFWMWSTWHLPDFCLWYLERAPLLALLLIISFWWGFFDQKIAKTNKQTNKIQKKKTNKKGKTNKKNTTKRKLKENPCLKKNVFPYILSNQKIHKFCIKNRHILKFRYLDIKTLIFFYFVYFL